MARPGLMIHRKFRRAVHLLQCSPALVRGSLECIWDAAYENGVPFIGDVVDVELASHWQGEPGKLCAVLADAGFLDKTEDGYEVHDLYDHAPEYVQKRVKREIERRERGESRKRSYAPRIRSQKATWRETVATNGHCPPISDLVRLNTGSALTNGVESPETTASAGFSPPNSELGSLNVNKADIGAPPAPAPNNTPLVPPSGGDGASHSGKRTRGQQRPAPLPPELDTPEFRAAWQEWLQHRREKRNAATPTAQKRQLDKLVPMGAEAATKAIEHSVAQGWTGIFPAGTDGKPAAAESEADRARENKARLEQYRQEEAQAATAYKPLLPRVKSSSDNGRATL